MEDVSRMPCGTCGRKKTMVKCIGCDAPVCETCAQFELVGSGCGCVWPAYYCPKCAWDPLVNPNAAFRDPPKRKEWLPPS